MLENEGQDAGKLYVSKGNLRTQETHESLGENQKNFKANLLYLKSSNYGHICVSVEHSTFIGAIVIDDLNSLEFVLTITVANAGFFFQGVLRSLKSTML